MNICNIGNRRTIILYHQFKGQGIGKLNLILFLVWCLVLVSYLRKFCKIWDEWSVFFFFVSVKCEYGVEYRLQILFYYSAILSELINFYFSWNHQKTLGFLLPKSKLILEKKFGVYSLIVVWHCNPEARIHEFLMNMKILWNKRSRWKLLVKSKKP